jgi:murein DD-endopeptidase MepM/ murein hydrolase activator NlpD
MRNPSWGTVAMAAAGSFLAGAIGVAVLMQWPRPDARLQPHPAVLAAGEVSKPRPPTEATPRIGLEPLADLRNRHLGMPVRGMTSAALVESFDDARDGRRHEAIDIPSPRNTPVLAVEDGTIAKLFQSKAGGTTIYQFDSTSTYAYYYAHLERYAEDLGEGRAVRRGDVIGYVGTSGNAPETLPHLHFAIFKLGPDRKWWEGTPIDPYQVFR